MATISLSPSKKQIKARRDAFAAKYFKPFTGTLDKPYDIESVKNKETARPDAKSLTDNIATFEEYLKNGKSKVIYGDYDLVSIDPCFGVNSNLREYPGAGYIGGDIFYVDRKTGFGFISHANGLKYHSLSDDFDKSCMDGDLEDLDVYEIFDRYEEDLTDIPQFIIKDGTCFLNADENATDMDGNSIVGKKGFEKFPTISFQCLVNLIEDEVIAERNFLKHLSKAKFSLIDFTPEVKKTLSESQRKAYSKIPSNKKIEWRRNQKPPEAGFSLVASSNGLVWHKSATVVLRSERTFLMGQDEGTYFGCILKDHPKSVAEAYESLIPKEAKGVKGIIRQGEWFAIPVSGKDVPKKTDADCLVWGESDNDFCFPVEDDDSNVHTLSGEWIVTTNGDLFAKNFCIMHDQHMDLRGSHDRWYTFARNTALASYSAEKVD